MKFEISEQWGIRYRALMKRFRDQHGDLTAQSLIAIGEAIFNAVDRQGPQVKDVVIIIGTPAKKAGGRKQVEISIGDLLETVRIQNPGSP